MRKGSVVVRHGLSTVIHTHLLNFVTGNFGPYQLRKKPLHNRWLNITDSTNNQLITSKHVKSRMSSVRYFSQMWGTSRRPNLWKLCKSLCSASPLDRCQSRNGVRPLIYCNATHPNSSAFHQIETSKWEDLYPVFRLQKINTFEMPENENEVNESPIIITKLQLLQPNSAQRFDCTLNWQQAVDWVK